MHELEYMLVLLSARIEKETGNKDLANAARSLASDSHNYIPEFNDNIQNYMNQKVDEWRNEFGHLVGTSNKNSNKK